MTAKPLFAALAICTAALVWLVWGSSNSPDDPSGISTANATRTAHHSAPAHDPAVASLRRDLADLAGEVSGLRREATADALPAAADDPLEAGRKTTPDEPPEDLAAIEREMAPLVAATLEAHLESEPRDGAWADEVDASLREVMARPTLASLELRDHRCASTLCRVDFADTSREIWDTVSDELVQSPPFDTEGFVHMPEDRPGEVIVYFARPEHSLPSIEL